MCSYEETECPLCGDELSDYDLSHPLQCPTQHCSFNFCLSCAENFIESTKGENEASDGNTFRVFLHCPNCRSNLGPSIRDTVLMRKVDKYKGVGSHAKDGDLKEREVRFRYALKHNEDIKSAVEAARKRENDFFHREEAIDNAIDNASCLEDSTQNSRTITSLTSRSISERSLWMFGDEEGFEADLTNGVHKSFIFRHQSSMSEDNIAEEEEPDIDNLEPDLTLLSGLDAFMTEQEKKYASYLMTSGDPSKLAAATDMLNYVSSLARNGIKPNSKRINSYHSDEARFAFKRRDSLMGSIREIIKEGNETRLKEEEKTHVQSTGGVVAPHIAANRSNRKRQADLEVKRQMEYMRLHPLPLRMPKYAEVLSRRGALNKIAFVDDIWDGFVIDAFAKITVYKPFLGSTMQIKKQHAESIGIRCVLNAGPAGSPRRSSKIDVDTPRVLVASINREMGQKGIVNGDVLTHVNGEEYKGTADELRKLLDSVQEGEMLTFAFNCDQAVAEALKRRSMIP